MQIFLVRHTLILPNGGIIIAHNNETRDEITHLEKETFYPQCVHGEPLIQLGLSRSEEEVHHVGSILETPGDVSIWVLWES